MIIAKEFIDASIDAKNAAEAAFYNAILEDIYNKLPEFKHLSDIIKDIMYTYRYLEKRDKGAACQMWGAMCREGRQFDLDFFSNLRIAGVTYCGVRPYCNRHDVRTCLCVTEIGIFFDLSRTYKLDELLDCTEPYQYGSTSKAISLLVDSVPKYRDCLANQLKEILK